MEILRDNIEERIRKVKEPEEPQGLDKIKKQINDVITLWVMGGIDPNKATPKTEIIEYLKEKGYSDEAVAGITANIEVETGGTFDYKEKEKGKGTGEGLFQYSGSMKNSYKDYLKSNKKKDSIESQIDFMDEVVRGTWEPGLANIERGILKSELFSGKFSPDRIAESFNSLFEEGQLQTGYGNRKDIAIDIYKDL